MKFSLDLLLAELKSLLETEHSLHAGFVFGSGLISDSPRDIDILLVYDRNELRDARSARAEVASLVERCWGGRPAHITMMTCTEIKECRILDEVQYRSIL